MLHVVSRALPNARFILAKHKAIACLQDLDALAHKATVQRLERGDLVWRVGERAADFIIVGHGLVRETRSLEARSWKITERLAEPGDLIGEVASFNGSLHETEGFCMLEGTVVARIPRGDLIAVFSKDAVAAMEIAKIFAREADGARWRTTMASAESEERAATAIVELADRFGEEMEDGTTVIAIRFTRTDLASLASCAQETMIRILSKWDKNGTVDTTKTSIVIKDMAALERLSLKRNHGKAAVDSAG